MSKAEAICEGACCLGFTFLLWWTIFSIVGAIHCNIWPPKFDLSDVHIRQFNVTPSGELNYDMDILIRARHFSGIRAIEQYSYEIRTSHLRKRIGSSSIPAFHPIRNETMGLSVTQNVKALQLEPGMAADMRNDLNSSGRVAIRVYIRGQIYTPLFLAMKKRGKWTCDLIVSPGLPFGSQIYDRVCCKRRRCLSYTSNGVSYNSGDSYNSADSSYCSKTAPNCCLLPPSSLNSTVSICG